MWSKVINYCGYKGQKRNLGRSEMGVTIEGQVVHIRKLSKNICFIDLHLEGNDVNDALIEHRIESNNSEPFMRRVTSVLKRWSSSSPSVMEQATKGPSKIHVGDVVSLSGSYDSEQVFAIRDFTIIARWATLHPNQTFQSLPPIRRPTTKLPELSTIRVCKAWLNTGQCIHPSNCPYAHSVPEDRHEDLGLYRARMVAQKLKSRRQIQLSQRSLTEPLNGNEAHENPQNSIELVSRHQRARIFAQFLVSKFDGLITNECSFVLDVAGGPRAEVAQHLLQMKPKMKRIVVIDPRESRRKCVEDRLEHIQELFDDTTFKRLLINEEGCRVALIIGMHPDEATEPLVDLALSYKVAFAVVPCCVFAHCNPHRRLKCGQEPRSYEQFIQYLKEKHIDIQSDWLGFSGRDLVLHWTPNQPVSE